MLEEQAGQQELRGKALLDDLASRGFMKVGSHEHIDVLSDGKEDVFYNAKTESVVCKTVAYKRDKV